MRRINVISVGLFYNANKHLKVCLVSRRWCTGSVENGNRLVGETQSGSLLCTSAESSMFRIIRRNAHPLEIVCMYLPSKLLESLFPPIHIKREKKHILRTKARFQASR